MPTAPITAGLSSQSHHGVGARLLRRLGGAVRSVAAALRRPAPSLTAGSQTSREHAAAQAPRPVRVPHRPRTAPAPLLLPRWLARLLTRPHRRSAAASRPAFLAQGDAPFTPEACPQLSPKACAVLNTPLKECDPKTLDLVLSAFTQHISELMSPEAGITGPEATFFPSLWHRLSTALADTNAAASLPATPEAVSATPADAVPDAPVVSPDPPAQATGPTNSSAKDAPPVSPLPLSRPPASDQPADVTITTAAPATTPDIAAPSAPVVHGRRALSTAGQSFRSYTRWRRRPFRCCRALFPPGVRDGLQWPPPWRLSYAACTGPP